jgi:hypothetical protein
MQAIEEGRLYPEYIWLTPGWYQGGWWRDDEAYLLTLNCSLSSLQQQLERSLTLLAHPNNVRARFIIILIAAVHSLILRPLPVIQCYNGSVAGDARNSKNTNYCPNCMYSERSIIMDTYNDSTFAA